MADRHTECAVNTSTHCSVCGSGLTVCVDGLQHVDEAVGGLFHRKELWQYGEDKGLPHVGILRICKVCLAFSLESEF